MEGTVKVEDGKRPRHQLSDQFVAEKLDNWINTTIY